jgi:hypothetical protein
LHKSPEEDGVDQRVEPPSWLPEGAAPEADDEVTATANGSAQADGAGEQEAAQMHDSPDSATSTGSSGAGEGDLYGQDTVSASTASLTGDSGEFPDSHLMADSGFSGGDQEPVAAGADPFTYGQAGSYTYEQDSQYGYHQQAPYTAEYAAGSGYNNTVMSQSAEDPPAPPLPSEVPSQAATASAGVPAFTTAAYRALPKPKFKTKPAAKPKGAAKSRAAAAEGRRANLVVARFEPWSVMKFSFLMSLVAWVVLFVAVALLYYLLSGLGVFTAIQKTLQSVTSSQTSAGVDLSKWTSASRILGYTMLIGAVNIVLITALSTVGAMIYNLVTHLGGGVEVTLKETD